MCQTFLLEWKLEAPKGELENCRYLQKLSVDDLRLNSFDIEQICQNGETLQTLRILSLEGYNIDFYLRTELIQKLFTKCSQSMKIISISMFGKVVNSSK